MARLSCLAIALLTVTSPALADVSYQLETSVATNYVVRGIAQYSTRHVPSSQNTLAVTLDHVGDGTLTLTGWNATALSDYDTQPGNSLEFDLTAAYAVKRDALAIGAGYVAYLYPNHLPGTPVDGAHELFGTLGYETRYVTPLAAVYVEPIRQQGAYVLVGATHDFTSGRWTVSPTITAGAAAYRKYLGGSQQASPHLNDVTAALAGKADLSGGVYATAKFSYALRGTPAELMPMTGWGFSGRSSIYGVVAVGIAR